MFVTSASFIVYGKALWNPITLIATIDQRYSNKLTFLLNQAHAHTLLPSFFFFLVGE